MLPLKKKTQRQANLPFTEFEVVKPKNDNARRPRNEFEEAFQAFHKANPHVYELVKRFAYEVIARGYNHYSLTAIIQRVRWHTEIETSGDTFKINNNHAAYYARLFHDDHPQHAGFFRTRAITGER